MAAPAACVAIALLSGFLAEAVQLTKRAGNERRSKADVFVQGVDAIEAWITGKGYPFELHSTATADDRLLTLFRLPKTGAPPVLLQHGLLDSAWAWVSCENFKALGFALHDAGYDVWLGNNRGNSFSRNWANGEDARNSKSFWNFTFDDMARFDIPALLNTILANSPGYDKVGYVGHSQGTMQLFIAATEPELSTWVSERISVFVALSPVAMVGNLEATLPRVISRARIGHVLESLFPNGFLEEEHWRSAVASLCSVTFGKICKLGVEIICGKSSLDPPGSITSYSSHFPSGTSAKNMIHFAQAIRESTFERFDYGDELNERIYGESRPRTYNLSNLAVPTALLVASEDSLSDAQDVARLLELIEPTGKVAFHRSYAGFSHVTWLLGSGAAAYYTDDVVEILNTFRPRGSRASASMGAASSASNPSDVGAIVIADGGAALAAA